MTSNSQIRVVGIFFDVIMHIENQRPMDNPEIRNSKSTLVKDSRVWLLAILIVVFAYVIISNYPV